jgi:hypothetical protein
MLLLILLAWWWWRWRWRGSRWWQNCGNHVSIWEAVGDSMATKYTGSDFLLINVSLRCWRIMTIANHTSHGLTHKHTAHIHNKLGIIRLLLHRCFIEILRSFVFHAFLFLNFYFPVFFKQNFGMPSDQSQSDHACYWEVISDITHIMDASDTGMYRWISWKIFVETVLLDDFRPNIIHKR